MAPQRNQMLLMQLVLLILCFRTKAYYSPDLLGRIHQINQAGPYLGLVIPNKFEMDPLLHSPVFMADEDSPYIDISGRRFRIGTVMNHRVIAVMTGLGMVNAGVTTQVLLGFFSIYGVIHFGTAGNANSGLHVGDVTIPRQWAHTGLWMWQKYGEGENDELPMEENGDYTRDIGYLNFANYSAPVGKHIDNLLNNLWFQPDEIFPVNGTPEAREHVFWIPVSQSYYELAQKIENVKLDSCVNSTCLSHEPRIVRVERGSSANIYVANAAYRSFLHDKFNVTSFDMESAGVAMICLSEGKPFISMRALVFEPITESSQEENKSGIFIEVATKNSVTAISQFINLLPSPRVQTFNLYADHVTDI